MKKKAKEKLKELIFTALGEASMCWTEIPKGIFDSTHAKEIGDKAVINILQLLKEEKKNERKIKSIF